MNDAPHRFELLRYRADLRSLALAGTLCALLAAQWIIWSRHWLLLPPTCVLVFVACIIKHNHMHCRTFRAARWNQAFSVLLSVLTGSPTTGIITAHNQRHHVHNNTELDFVRGSLVNFRWNGLNLLAFPFVSVWTMFREKPNDLERWRLRRPLLYRQAIVERTVTYGFLCAILILEWKATLVYFVGPWLFGQWALVSINLLQHQGCDRDSLHNHSRNITGRFINWLFLNNGFHTAHHMRPALHWSLLQEFHREQVAPRIRQEFNERSLALALWRQFLVPRRVGRVWGMNSC